MKIFWAWQSDTAGKIGRFLIRDALNDAINQLKQPPDIEEPTAREIREALHLDYDRQNVPGSPDLARTILDKIDASEVVIADVTLIGQSPDSTNAAGERVPGKKLINSNVAIELGYALSSLTDQKVLMVFNEYYGNHEELPFDLRHKGGAIVFNVPPNADKACIEDERKKLKARFVEALAPYLSKVPGSPVSFQETPSTFSKAAYFGEYEVLAQVGEPKVDQVDFLYGVKNLCYLRLIPVAGLASPLQLAELVSAASSAPLLFNQRTGKPMVLPLTSVS
ncbi:MAG: hypothetical protein NT123_24435 [Proteobacteria bacterium]|nr:hypothetical protein [Pseudomonadota bacterium]